MLSVLFIVLIFQIDTSADDGGEGWCAVKLV